MTRAQVPPLTDTTAWHQFPYLDYDLVIIDSLDASAEGVGKKDSAKPSKAIAPILDIAWRTGGPAFLKRRLAGIGQGRLVGPTPRRPRSKSWP